MPTKQLRSTIALSVIFLLKICKGTFLTSKRGLSLPSFEGFAVAAGGSTSIGVDMMLKLKMDETSPKAHTLHNALEDYHIGPISNLTDYHSGY